MKEKRLNGFGMLMTSPKSISIVTFFPRSEITYKKNDKNKVIKMTIEDRTGEEEKKTSSNKMFK